MKKVILLILFIISISAVQANTRHHRYRNHHSQYHRHSHHAVHERRSESRLAEVLAIMKNEEYDSAFKGNAMSVNWRIVKAACAVESGLKPNAHNKSGATGICQMKRETFRANSKRGNIHNAAHNIAAANVYLSKLNSIWADSVKNKLDRQKYILASYNSGEGHVAKANKKCGRGTYAKMEPCLPKETRNFVKLIMASI